MNPIGLASVSFRVPAGPIRSGDATGGWDPKETWSLITWFVYAILLHARLMRGWRGKRIAVISIVGFAAVMVTYFGVNYLPGLHSYGSVRSLLKEHIINPFEFAPGGIMVVFDLEGRILPMTFPAQGE